MTSLGLSALTYMARLKPELESRGFEVAIFHATGMGGRAFRSTCRTGAFVAVMDFCTQELGNHVHGSSISAGETRLKGAGRVGIPQIVAPGCYDLVDVIGWQELAAKWDGYPTHAHNRLITSVVLREADCLFVADAHLERLARAQTDRQPFFFRPAVAGNGTGRGRHFTTPMALPLSWGGFLPIVRKMSRFTALMRTSMTSAFAEAALAVLDSWIAAGHVPNPA